jgi:hypothetical protein
MKLFVIAIASAVAVIEPIPSVRFEKHGLLPANETRPGGQGARIPGLARSEPHLKRCKVTDHP